MINNSYKGISSDITKVIRRFTKKRYVPLHEPTIRNLDLSQVKRNLLSTQVSTSSSDTIKFENSISKFTNSKYSVAIINGTSSLQLAIKVLDIKDNDEVFIPSLNYVASSNATLYCGAIPHYIDIELENFGIDVKKLEKYILKNCIYKKKKLINKKTKRPITAIIPTHIFGTACNIDQILRISQKYNLKVIEDAAEGFGSFYKKKHLGTFGHVGVLSFNGNKIITTGGGGAMLTQNKKYYVKALKLAKIAKKEKNFWDYDYSELGYNFRLPGINASLGLSQIKNINNLLKRKKIIFNKMKFLFKKNKNYSLVVQQNNSESNNWLNNIYIFNSNYSLRNKIINTMLKQGISVRPVWKLMHKIKYLSIYPKMNLENAVKAEKSLISIPSSPSLIR